MITKEPSLKKQKTNIDKYLAGKLDNTNSFLDNSALERQNKFASQKFKDFINIDNKFGLSDQDALIFGNRAPEGYKKLGLLSKLKNQVYWIFKRIVEPTEEDEEPEATYHVVQ